MSEVGHFKVEPWCFGQALRHFKQVVRLAQEAKRLAIQSHGYADLAQEFIRISNWDGVLE